MILRKNCLCIDCFNSLYLQFEVRRHELAAAPGGVVAGEVVAAPVAVDAVVVQVQAAVLVEHHALKLRVRYSIVNLYAKTSPKVGLKHVCRLIAERVGSS